MVTNQFPRIAKERLLPGRPHLALELRPAAPYRVLVILAIASMLRTNSIMIIHEYAYVHTYTCVCIYIYIYVYVSLLPLSLSLYIYIYTHTHEYFALTRPGPCGGTPRAAAGARAAGTYMRNLLGWLKIAKH